MSQVSIEAVVTPVVSHAMAHTNISPVQRIEIANAGAAREAAELTVGVTDGQGSLSHAWSKRLDLAAESSIALGDAGLRLRADMMEQVEEARPGTVRIKVTHNDEELGSAEYPVQVLAGSQWLAVPHGLAEELLAVHVMPNAPQITALMPRVAELVGTSTGRPALDGYQSGDPERADALAAAVFDALQEKGITYAEPPASWADVGQKVRTPASVIDGGLGTCLDTCVVMAAALEQVGLRPQIWILDGHAVLGYWRAEVESSSAVTYDAADLMNVLDLGYLAIVETTALTDRQVTFEQARAAGWRKVHADMAAVLRVLDIHAARRSRITPLPAVSRVDGVVNVVEYRPAEHSVAPAEQAQAAASDMLSTTVNARPMPRRVQQWKNALLDLGLRNRLINFTARSAIHLHLDAGSVQQLEDDLNGHRQVALRPSDAVPDALKAQYGRTAADLPEHLVHQFYAEQRAAYTDIGSDAYLSRLRSLAYKARTIQEETGANNLYLALGSLVWELDGRPLRSPLVLVPLVMKAGRGAAGLYQITGDEAGQSTPNYCLLERLRQSFDLDVPGLENPAMDASGIDLAAAFGAMRRALAEKGLPFHVEETADIAILQFAKYRLWKDIDDSWEQLLAAPLVRHLALSPTDEFTDPVPAGDAHDLESLATQCPIPADGSQLTAVAEALAGRTFVLEGPPGTGKSQTIANLLARAIATGQKVLFVAEKRAALDVVSSRVDAVGLGDFTLDLHDKLSKPAVVRRQIAHALDLTVRGDTEGLQAQTEVVRSAGGVLERYARRLHEPNGAGLSMYSAETQRLVLADGTDAVLPVPEHLVQPRNEQVIEELRQLMRLLPEVADGAFPSPDAPWLFAGADSPEAIDIAAAARAARSVEDAARGIDASTRFGRAVRAACRPEDARTLMDAARSGLPLELLDEVRTERWQGAVAHLEGEIARFEATSAPVLAPATPAMLDLPLDELHARALAAAQSSFFGRRKRQLAVLDDVRPGLIAGADVPRKELVAHLARWLQIQQAMRTVAGYANRLPGVQVPETWSPLAGPGRQQLTDRIASLRALADGVDPVRRPGSFTSALRELLAERAPLDPRSLAMADAFADALGTLARALQTSSDALATWAGPAGVLPRWVETSGRRDLHDPQLRSLTRWIELRRHLAPLKRHGMDEAHELLLTGRIVSDTASLAFERGIVAASLIERPRAQGLDAFDTAAHQRSVQRFVDAGSDARTMLRGVLPLRALTRRRFAGDSTAGQVGRLKRELSRQRGGLSVRELMGQFGELITEIMPCVLVSPDSVARFLPVGSQTFDIVVFDEASQIRVADAVGAIGRGRSVVVVGDSKQMPPTSFAEVSWRADGDDEDDAAEPGVVEDEESILSECVQARVRREWLTWHYRSQDEALIAFSNAHYYDGKLSSFPSPVIGGADRSVAGHGISLVRVPGEFLRNGGGKLKRTNPVEAQAVVEEIRRRFALAPAGTVPSIGVVTFNQQQRAHIEALIRDTGDERLIEALESSGANGLFIKNLENVQGDERDVILFSTAFSVNERGVLPLNFGPLNRAGGERRLNVAITRARRQVVLFSSFDPGQLRAEETSSVGVKHLRSYLEVAASGTGSLERAITRTVNIDRHRDEMADALRARGLVVSADVGLSDFRVDLQLALASEPGQPLVAVLLDGPLWATRRTVGDRDGMPSDVLRKTMRWPAVERVWLPEWLSDRDAVLDRLERSVRTATLAAADREVVVLEAEDDDEPADVEAETWFDPARRADTRPESAGRLRRDLVVSESGAPEGSNAPRRMDPQAGAADMRTSIEPTASNADLTTSNQRTFESWSPDRAGELDILDALGERTSRSRRAAQRVREVLEAGIHAEGPIHADRLAKLTAGAFGLSRVAAVRTKSILAVAPGLPDSGGFYWAPGIDPLSWSAYRIDPHALRPLEHISEIELANAMRALCIGAHGMSTEELWAETLRVFGYKRRTPATLPLLERALATGRSTGRLDRAPDGLVSGA